MNTPGQEVATNDPNTIQVATAASSPAVANGAAAPAPYAGAARPPGGPVSSGKEQSLGVGTEGEVAVWKGRYSFKNFIMRIVIRTVVTIA